MGERNFQVESETDSSLGVGIMTLEPEYDCPDTVTKSASNEHRRRLDQVKTHYMKPRRLSRLHF